MGRQSIVGMRFQGAADDLIEDLHPGSRVTFLREPENDFDPNAILALDEQDRKLGYIPRRENRVLSALMDAGKVLYGIIPNVPREQYAYSRRYPIETTRVREIPVTITVDLYMREFAMPEDMTVIPRHGSDGSYAVVDLTVLGNRIQTICAIKVINGEERDLFFEDRMAIRTQDGEERSRECLEAFRKFIGYLPIVSHGIEGRKLHVLEELYGVQLGKPLPNLVIDTEEMAENHLPRIEDRSLQNLAEELGINPEGDSGPEQRCRATLALYRRMDKSEL